MGCINPDRNSRPDEAGETILVERIDLRGSATFNRLNACDDLVPGSEIFAVIQRCEFGGPECRNNFRILAVLGD
jgi:hypothetical protein